MVCEIYQRTRLETGQYGYTLFPDPGPWILENPTFKSARTITKWIQDQKFRVTWVDVHWQGYFEFGFRHFAPKIPMIGQYKHHGLLRRYLRSQPYLAAERACHRYSWDELENLYKRKIRPEICERGEVLSALGLRQLKLKT
jgi:hypothetical protein